MPNKTSVKNKLVDLLARAFVIYLTTVAVTIFMSRCSKADTIVKYGANVPSDSEKLGRTKAIFVSEQEEVISAFITQYEVGAWFDNSGIKDRMSSAMVSASGGINVNAGYVFAQALVGPALISSPDSSLGGVFQFNNDIAFGLRDPDTKATFGLNYKHLSSAGLESPNRGRDFILIRLSVPFN